MSTNGTGKHGLFLSYISFLKNFTFLILDISDIKYTIKHSEFSYFNKSILFAKITVDIKYTIECKHSEFHDRQISLFVKIIVNNSTLKH